MSPARALTCPTVALGVLSTAAQVVLIRELLVAFTGNELTIALTLAAWVLAAAAGSLLIAGLSPGHRPSAATLLIIGALVVPFQVVSIRLLHAAVSGVGEMLSPGMMALLVAAGAFPPAMLLGAAFVAILAGAAGSAEAWSGRPLPLAYGLEALGAGAAGLGLSAYFLEAWNPLAVAALAGLVGLAGAWAAWPTGPRRPRALRPAVIAPAALVLLATVAAGNRVDLALRQVEWRPLEVELVTQSRYNSIIVASRDSVYHFFETGALAFTIPDLLYAEESAHIPLGCHPSPHRVLVIGGAGSGVIGEILKHKPVKTVDYVEPDPVLVSAIQTFAPPAWLAGAVPGSVSSNYGDGRQYVARTRSMYDVAIVCVGSPTSLQVNRYYTLEFLRSVERVLDRNGILALKIAVGGSYLSPDAASLVATIANAAGTVFPKVLVLPGEYVHVLASPGLDLAAQTGLVGERLARRGIEASYVNRFALWDRFSPRRMAEVDSVLAVYNPGVANSDLRPVAFSSAISIWQRHFGAGGLVSGISAKLNGPLTALALVVCGLACAATYGIACGARRCFPDVLALYFVGVATMSTQVLCVLGYQVVSGYIYSRIATVVAAFMVGMGVAATLCGLLRRLASPRRLSYVLGLALALTPAIALAALRAFSADPKRLETNAADVVFPAIALATGALGGLVFAHASAAMEHAEPAVSRRAALAYSADLVGASVAGLATGSLIVPALGMAGTAYAISGAGVTALAIVVIWKLVFPACRPR
jgi:spermidine synthase